MSVWDNDNGSCSAQPASRKEFIRGTDPDEFEARRSPLRPWGLRSGVRRWGRPPEDSGQSLHIECESERHDYRMRVIASTRHGKAAAHIDRAVKFGFARSVVNVDIADDIDDSRHGRLHAVPLTRFLSRPAAPVERL